MTDSAAVERPFAPSCERNRAPILAVLARVFADRRAVLELGSGTGQHAVHFAAALPWLQWQCSDRADALPGMRAWLDDAALPNTPVPVELDVATGPWPRVRGTRSATDRNDDGQSEGVRNASTQPGDAHVHDAQVVSLRTDRFDAAFTANTLHIMGWTDVEACFAGLDETLADDATLVVYGPFNRDGDFTSDSNRQFDAWLKARDPRSGVRDLDAVDALARSIRLRRTDLIDMPSNNLCVVWRRD